MSRVSSNKWKLRWKRQNKENHTLCPMSVINGLHVCAGEHVWSHQAAHGCKCCFHTVRQLLQLIQKLHAELKKNNLQCWRRRGRRRGWLASWRWRYCWRWRHCVEVLVGRTVETRNPRQPAVLPSSTVYPEYKRGRTLQNWETTVLYLSSRSIRRRSKKHTTFSIHGLANCQATVKFASVFPKLFCSNEFVVLLRRHLSCFFLLLSFLFRLSLTAHAAHLK